MDELASWSPWLLPQVSISIGSRKRVSAHLWLKMSKEEGPENWTRIPPRQRPKDWDDIEDPILFRERNSYGMVRFSSRGEIWRSVI